MIEKPKKERRFLKTLGRVGEILIQEVLLKVGSNLIKRIGGKKTLPSILILFLSISLFAQYPTNPNKQRLGFQTTADGLVWRGSISDTASIQPVSNQNAWVILDTVNLKIYSFDFTSNVWNQVSTGGGSAFTQPVDSLFFKTSVSPNNVDTAKMRWDSELGTVVLGMYDKVPNELGFKNFWLVKNQTGSTITKNSLVYASGTVGSSGRISVSKFIANGTIDAKYLLGITAHDLSNGEDGYVISFGKIRQVNTDTFAAGAILYPSPKIAGVWTDVEPIAPNLDMPVGFCINSSSNNGTIAIRVASGYKLNELHDVAISSPVDRASLYYRGGLWRDTTTALLVSDTASMLSNYLRSGVAASTYLTQSNAASTYLPLTGGTLSGNLNLASGIVNTWQSAYLNAPKNNGPISYGYFFNLRNSTGETYLGSRVIHNYMYSNDENTAAPASLYYGRFNGFYAGNYSATNNNIIYDASIYYHNTNQFYYRAFSEPENKVTFSIKPSTTVNSITGTKADLYLSGDAQIDRSLNIGTTLGVTGATTLTGALTVNNATVFNEDSDDFDTRIESDGNANMVFVDAGLNRVGIGTGTPSKTLDVNGEVKIATVTATPTALLGKDGSNVVGEVTDINQSGVMKVGGITATTNAVGGINVAHGLPYTPSKVIATIAQANSYVIVVTGYTSTNIEFTIYDSTTGIGLDTVSVGFFWLAFK